MVAAVKELKNQHLLPMKPGQRKARKVRTPGTAYMTCSNTHTHTHLKIMAFNKM